MGVTITMTESGRRALRATLRRIAPKTNPRVFSDAMVECALLVQRIAAKDMIIRGGRVLGPAGPRGGRGKMMDTPATQPPTRLTSRTGHLRGSLEAAEAINRRYLPGAIEVGTNVVYAAIHELGGSITITPRMRRVLHAIGIHPRASTTRVRISPRPFLKPALDKAAEKFSSIFAKHINWEIQKP